MKKIVLIAAMIITGLSFQARGQDYYNRGYDNNITTAGIIMTVSVIFILHYHPTVHG